MDHFKSLRLPVSFVQRHGWGERRGNGWGVRIDWHQALERMRGHRRREGGDGRQHACFLSVQHELRPVHQAGVLPDAELVLVLVLRAAVAQIRYLQVRVRLRVLLHASPPLRGALPARPVPRSQADSPQPQVQPRAWGVGLHRLPLAQRGSVADVCPTQRQASRIGWQTDPSCLTTRRAVCPPILPCYSSLSRARLRRGEQRGEGVRQLGEAALQRIRIKLGGIKGARRQFGAVIEREGPWEVGVKAPRVVEGWTARIRAQQGRGFGVALGT